MRICLYTGTALPKLGGQEAVVDALARHFTTMGHRAVVLAPRPRQRLPKGDRSLPYPVFRHPRLYSSRYFVPWYRHWLLRLYARERFDVVHCHDVYPTGYLASLCREEIPAAIVITSHGGDVKEGNVRISKPGLLPRYVKALRNADALISIGKFTEEGYRRLAPSPPRIVTIPNGIDLAPFNEPAPRPAQLDATVQPGRYALFLGRLKHRKGVDVLLEAMKRLAPGEGVRLVIAGAGEDGLKLEDHMRSLGLAGSVRFVGRVDGADKIYLLQNALFTVMPSRVWEAFPLVLLESFAARRPVVGSAVPGIADLIEENHTGLLAPDEIPGALADAMRLLFENPARATELGDNARRFAEKYAWDVVARQHIELYEEIVALRSDGATPSELWQAAPKSQHSAKRFR